MRFCEKEKQPIGNGITTVDNRFIINYLPDAPDVRSAVYLLGLTLCTSDGTDNSCATIAAKLNLSEREVLEAFLYWDELGLVHITSDDPPQIIYLSLKESASALKKINPSKYAKFSKEMQSVIEGRMITTTEYNEYFTFLENTTFEPAALIAVAKYCVELKGNAINYRYILTVARNQLLKGATGLAAVQDNLNSQQKYDADLTIVFKALGSNRKFDYSDREMYEKWTKDFGFAADVIVNVAKTCKSGGMGKLDALLTEYYKKGALSVKEIEFYQTQKQRLYDLARNVNKAIGVYYQSLDAVVDEYVTDWLRRGFDDDTIVAIAKYCFKSGIRTLAGVASVMEKLHKNGVTTLDGLHTYLAALEQTDEQISAVLNACGLERKVTSGDRNLYKTWTLNWQMPQDVILLVAKRSAGTNAPMAYISRVLSDLAQRNVRTAEQAQTALEQSKQSTATTASPNIGGVEIERRNYTEQQLNMLFTALDETEE